MIRALLRGDEVTVDGHVRVDRARLWTLPATPPPLIGAALSEETAAWCGGWADGLITVHMPPDRLRPADRRVPGRWRRGQAGAGAGQGGVGAHRGGGPGGRPRAVAHQRVRLGAHGRHRDGRSVRGGGGPRAPRGRAAERARVARSQAARRVAARDRSTSVSTICSSTRCPASSDGSSTRSAPRCCPRWRRDERRVHERPVVEERRRVLPRCRDVPRLGRRRRRRPRRPGRADRLPGRHRRLDACG